MTDLKVFGTTYTNVTGIKATDSSDAIVTFESGGGGGSGALSLIDTITIPEDTRAVNLDLTPYRNDYDILIAWADFTLSASDWLYYARNGSEPSGGVYTQGVSINHKGVAYGRLQFASPSLRNIEMTPGSNGISSGANVYDNLYIYTYVSTKMIKAGSTIKIYGGNHADL